MEQLTNWRQRKKWHENTKNSEESEREQEWNETNRNTSLKESNAEPTAATVSANI